jgi:hypothetical protein
LVFPPELSSGAPQLVLVHIPQIVINLAIFLVKLALYLQNLGDIVRMERVFNFDVAFGEVKVGNFFNEFLFLLIPLIDLVNGHLLQLVPLY